MDGWMDGWMDGPGGGAVMIMMIMIHGLPCAHHHQSYLDSYYHDVPNVLNPRPLPQSPEMQTPCQILNLK